MMEKEFICITDHFFEHLEEDAPLAKDSTFEKTIGGKTYEVTTHFNTDGRQSVLEQFRDIILSEHLI